MKKRKLITKADAKALGLKRFYTGGQCRKGHDAEQWVADGHCCQCSIESLRRYNNRNRRDRQKNHGVIPGARVFFMGQPA